MAWLLTSLPVHTFSSLGYVRYDTYHINDNCNGVLETILHFIRTEDKCLRSYRRGISFAQNMDRELIPLLVHAKDDVTIELIIKILENLTTPIECLLTDFVLSQAFSQSTLWQLNNALSSTKASFSDQRVTNVLIKFLKRNVKGDSNGKLSEEQCANVGSSLLLLRNILHIPEAATTIGPGYGARGTTHTMQNQIIWNIFSQGIDKIMIKLMCVDEASNWSKTMLELLAILYKDQQKELLHQWLSLLLQAPLSGSSENDESNTSSLHTGSDDSSPMLTPNPTLDAADMGSSGSGMSNVHRWGDLFSNKTSKNDIQAFQPPPSLVNKPPDTLNKPGSMDKTGEGPLITKNNKTRDDSGIILTKHVPTLENYQNYYCGRGQQIENQESISMDVESHDWSSSEDGQRPKSRYLRIQKNTNKASDCMPLQGRKRRKLVERGECSVKNMQGVSHKTPTDVDIFNIIKEFTIDFLLKGFNSLVQTLHKQLLSNRQLQIDISLFLWLVSYFLRCATQLELDLEHVRYVISYDMISYLTAEGVTLFEQFQLAIKFQNQELSTCDIRMRLIVAVIREFVQAVEVHKTSPYIVSLKVKMWEIEELRSFFVLLIRNFNTMYNTKEYLQDVIVANDMLLSSMDSVLKLPNYRESTCMCDHLTKFTAPEMMYQYALLLEDYSSNAELVNGSIFTMMHHVGSNLGCVSSLLQPKILSLFVSIKQSNFKVSLDMFNLIKVVIHTYTMKMLNVSFKEDKILPKPVVTPPTPQGKTETDCNENKQPVLNGAASGDAPSNNWWTMHEQVSLGWHFMQLTESQDLVGELVKLLKESCIIKSRKSIIKQLYKQKLLNKEEFVTSMNKESDNANYVRAPKETKDDEFDEIRVLCQQLSEDGKFKLLEWVQKVLLDTCFAYIYICRDKKYTKECAEVPDGQKDVNNNFDFLKKIYECPVVSPLAYHYRIYRHSVPLVPWTCEQAAICKNQKFLQLLHKLGFQLPHETRQVFIRIPHFWTAGILYDIASKIAPIDTPNSSFH